MVEALVPQSEPVAAAGRVLVVDDDPHINRLLQVRLRARGFAVGGAADGEQALAAIEACPPDLVFLDVSMPGIGGLEVLEAVRSRGLDVAIIMTTAFGSEQVAIEALRRGADDYLRKPFEPAEFQVILDRTLARLRISRQNAALRLQLDEKRHELEAELSRAAQVQMDLLPREVPALPGFDLAGLCVSAQEVGGDFYDWQEPEPGVLTLAIADVMGKGMPAAILMATVRAALRAVVQQNAPAAALGQLATAIEPDLAHAGAFVTLQLARLDAARRRLTYVDAGHGLSFVRRADGVVEQPDVRGLPLGVLPLHACEEGVLDFRPGDALVLYSDGLMDALPAELRARATLAAQLAGAGSAAEMVERLISLAGLSGPLPDDLTVMVLLCTGG